MAVVVTGLGWVSALGQNAPETWQRLLRGDSAIALCQPFAALSPRPLAMMGKWPSDLNTLLLTAVTAAVSDAQLSLPLPDCGVVIGSSRGYQRDWEAALVDDHVAGWLAHLPHMGAITVARQLASHGPVLSPMAACATGLWAIAQGAELIRTGQCDQVLVGAGEAPITPLALTGFEQMKALAQTGCYPFDDHREGLVLGEGAAVLMLESAAAAQARGAKIYGRILGTGLTADANHISAPDAMSQQGGLSALNSCLQRSQLQPTDVSFVHAHGTSTRLNDAYEAALIQTVLPSATWVTGTKGATGHTLGASGAMGAAACLLALNQQMLPPCTGLRTAAFDLNLVKQATSASLDTALCMSFGFGGQNAMVAFSR
ncbi:MAG: beta-ketoacyl-ACP synthase [Cyanobacteria bacterium P01_H01_bin.162]